MKTFVPAFQRKNAKRLRTDMSEPEGILWAELRAGRFSNIKFRRQVPIDRYIADFLCHEYKLIIELDGEQHGEMVEQDAARDAILARHGFRVLRIWNHELRSNKQLVLDNIWHAIESGDTPSPRG